MHKPTPEELQHLQWSIERRNAPLLELLAGGRISNGVLKERLLVARHADCVEARISNGVLKVHRAEERLQRAERRGISNGVLKAPFFHADTSPGLSPHLQWSIESLSSTQSGG